MPWVRSEYAGELAVLSVWLTALMPWSFSHLNRTIAGARWLVINIRFMFFQFGFRWRNGKPVNFQTVKPVWELAPFGSLSQVVRPSGWTACPPEVFLPCDQVVEGRIWLLGATVFALVLVLSVLYYAREELVAEELPVDPVRFFGGAFALLALVFTAVVVLFNPHQLTVPVGTLFMWVFAIVLLRIERT